MTMQIFTKRAELSPYLDTLRERGQSIGFVPTMGALHRGHMSLVERSRASCAITVCSIFVNPTQFNDPSDLARYPRPIEQDISMLQAAGCDILYLPETEDVYPEGGQGRTFDLKGLDRLWEGASRPGHFAGVAAVVDILLDITHPDKLFLGQKDLQQYTILRQLAATNYPATEVVMCPIIREAHGLAMSSRNIRLNAAQRIHAGSIHATMEYARILSSILPLPEARETGRNSLNGLPGFSVDYFTFVRLADLSELEVLDGTEPAAIITAVIVDGVRLLDNMVL